MCVSKDVASDEMNHVSFVSTTDSLDNVVVHAVMSIVFTQHMYINVKVRQKITNEVRKCYHSDYVICAVIFVSAEMLTFWSMLLQK